MKILLTGFDPFGGEKINPSYEAVKRTVAPNGIELIKLEIPTEFKASMETAAACIEKEHPDVILCVGQAGGRRSVCLERVAINIMDAAVPDNAGFMPTDLPIEADGENAFFSTVPIKKIVSDLKEKGIPAAVSDSAGTYVCNRLLYGVLSLCRKKYPDTKAGFVHVPFAEEQVKNNPQMPFMTLEKITEALEAIMKTLVQ